MRYNHKDVQQLNRALMNVMSFAIKVPLKHNTSPNMK